MLVGIVEIISKLALIGCAAGTLTCNHPHMLHVVLSSWPLLYQALVRHLVSLQGFLGISKGFGFTKKNELFVGRVAMLGFASELVGEQLTGGKGPLGQVRSFMCKQFMCKTSFISLCLVKWAPIGHPMNQMKLSQAACHIGWPDSSIALPATHCIIACLHRTPGMLLACPLILMYCFQDK